MIGTYATSFAIVQAAGVNISDQVSSSYAFIKNAIDDAEGYVNMYTRQDWVATSAAVTTNFKTALAMVTRDLAAIDLIKYDMGAIGNNEASNRINVLTDRVNKTLKFLEEDKVKKAMGVS